MFPSEANEIMFVSPFGYFIHLVGNSEAGEKEMTNSKNRFEAIRVEARDTCLTNNWNGMVQMMALFTVLRRPIFRIDFL